MGGRHLLADRTAGERFVRWSITGMIGDCYVRI